MMTIIMNRHHKSMFRYHHLNKELLRHCYGKYWKIPSARIKTLFLRGRKKRKEKSALKLNVYPILSYHVFVLSCVGKKLLTTPFTIVWHLHFRYLVLWQSEFGDVLRSSTWYPLTWDLLTTCKTRTCDFLMVEKLRLRCLLCYKVNSVSLTACTSASQHGLLNHFTLHVVIVFD